MNLVMGIIGWLMYILTMVCFLQSQDKNSSALEATEKSSIYLPDKLWR